MPRVHSADAAAAELKRQQQLRARSTRRYRIREERDEGFGRFHLYCNGDWLETFHTREAAEAEELSRMEADAARGRP